MWVHRGVGGMAGGPADVIYLLLLLQVGVGLLAAAGPVFVMANPGYLVLPAAKAVLLVVLAIKIGSGRRWAVVTVIVVAWVGLLGVWLGMLVGLSPWLTPSITVTGLLAEIGLPVAVIWLCGRLLNESPGKPRTPTLALR